jgi:hypothetical protein
VGRAFGSAFAWVWRCNMRSRKPRDARMCQPADAKNLGAGCNRCNGNKIATRGAIG